MSVRRLGRYAHPPNSFLHCFVWCVWVRTFRPCISCLPWMSLLWLAVACVLLVWFSSLVLQGSSLSLLLFGVLVWLLSPFLSDLAAWVLAVWPALSWLPPPSLPPWLSSILVLSGPVSPAGPSLQISGCICNGPVVIPLAWRVVADWLVSSLRFMATKASALCGALPSPPCCGCCSCVPRCGTEVFALG